MTGDQQKDALEERQKEIDEALATSDACWRMEQEVLQRQLDEARAEVERLRAALEETEHAMHLRIRAGYDKTIADAWRAKVAEVEEQRNANAREIERLRKQLAAVGATTAPLYTSQEREVLIQQRDEARAAESYMERQLLAVKQECDELRDYAETVGLQAVTDASETYKVVVGERDIAEAELARVEKERDALRDALQWYVDHDDTNEGGRWEESNAGWLEGKRRARALLASGKKP